MYGVKKLISVRVDEEEYEKIKKHLEEKNKQSSRWPPYSFAEIIDHAMYDYIKNNNIK